MMIQAAMRDHNKGIASMARQTPRANEGRLPWQESPSISPGKPDEDDRQRLLRAMIALLTINSPNSDAEALQMLRDGFPETPLALRIAAFAARFKGASE
jgi:hypothetical protein